MQMVKLTMWTGRLDDLERETTCPVVVDAAKVRNFYPRKDGREGTRLTFDNSAGMAVKEPFHVVAAAFGLTGVEEFVPAPAPAQQPLAPEDLN